MRTASSCVVLLPVKGSVPWLHTCMNHLCVNRIEQDMEQRAYSIHEMFIIRHCLVHIYCTDTLSHSLPFIAWYEFPVHSQYLSHLIMYTLCVCVGVYVCVVCGYVFVWVCVCVNNFSTLKLETTCTVHYYSVCLFQVSYLTHKWIILSFALVTHAIYWTTQTVY